MYFVLYFHLFSLVLFYKLPYFNFYVYTLYISYIYFHGTLIVFLTLGFIIFNKQAKIIWWVFFWGGAVAIVFLVFSFSSFFLFWKK